MKYFKFVLLTIIPCIFIQCHRRDTGEQTDYSRLSDAESFALEFPLVGSDNIFVYRNASETVDILTNGRGIVFMGFQECPWCQLYVVILHDVAREMGIEKIYYLDIREDRQNNTESYQRIVSILSGRLQYDDEGRPRVYVPDLTIVSRGRIILHDFPGIRDTYGYSPQEYWNDDRMNELKERFRVGINILLQLSNRPCSPC